MTMHAKAAASGARSTSRWCLPGSMLARIKEAPGNVSLETMLAYVSGSCRNRVRVAE